MNPFDLIGPEFLFFYFCFSIIVIVAIVVLRRRAESGPAPKIDLGDPYLIAYLRGGENEALRVAVVSLVDRGMLVMDDYTVRRADHVTAGTAKNSIEYEVLKKFGAPDKAASVFKDSDLKSEFQPYRDKLELAGLMPDSAVRSARVKRLLLALTALGIVGVIKIQIGLSLERPVSFLVVMMIVAMIIAAVSSFPRLTARGKATLDDITNLYSGLKARVNSFSPGSSSAELAMFAAVFGVAALAATPFGYARTLFPQATSGSSCGSACGSSDSSSGSSDGGSSCGSSSDGGGGCGGGGCGGCGS
ncbi:MAG TPA: TIGR04222 domain-containing membrane protein [Blastocatellia bacterium]|nr:TIGR04222 domain-containing membrane protein [Blastocatellia bacterium]